MQRILRRNGHQDLGRRISRAVAGAKQEAEIIDRVSLVLDRIARENAVCHKLISRQAAEFFRLYNDLWA